MRQRIPQLNAYIIRIRDSANKMTSAQIIGTVAALVYFGDVLFDLIPELFKGLVPAELNNACMQL